MNNYRKISFDIDFAGKKVLNTIQMPLEELTQNDFNSSLLTLKLMQGQELINLQGLSVVLNFLMPSGKDYVDTINAEMIDIENSIVSYSIPKDILSEVGMVVGTVSLYKEGYRYTSIVQFKFEVVSDFVEDGEIVESDNYPILAQMIGEVQNLKDEEMKRVESEIERIENEEERESSELQREMNEVERHEAENVRIINEQNREVKELERDQAERLREANSAKVKREEETRLEAETLRVQAESLRIGAESDRIQAESIRQMQESDRHEKELERQASENLRVLAEIEREQKQNEFNTRAEEVAVRIEEESQRISDLVEIEESKLVKPNDMVDYMGNQHNSLKAKSDSDVDYAVKTAIGEFNYLDYEGQHITATNSIEGHAKSAILKGCTLVNLTATNDINFTAAWQTKQLTTPTLVGGKKYIVVFNCDIANADLQLQDRNGTAFVSNIKVGFNAGINKNVITLSPTATGLQLRSGTTFNVITTKIMVLEYQEGMENWDIPYFESMQSVRMPVLKTTGKNLFNADMLTYGGINYTGNAQYLPDTSNFTRAVLKQNNLIEVKPNSTLTLSCDSGFKCIIQEYDENEIRTMTNDRGWQNKGFHTLQVSANTRKVNLYFTKQDPHSATDITSEEFEVLKNSIQLEEGSVATSYEPHKSNILSTPSDLELRGISDVRDTLDCITGEKVERIGEIMLDGSENWALQTASTDVRGAIYRLSITDIDTTINNTLINCVCDKAMVGSWQNMYATLMNKTFAVLQNQQLRVQFDGTLEELKTWLSETQPTIQYLKQEVIKTVDLSDNVVYSYNGTTHYSCSSEEGSLVPTLSVKVPTDVQEVISEQRKIISEQEEAQNILIDSQLSLYESISGVQTLQTDGEEVQMPQYIIDLYELAYKRGIRKKGER